MTTSPRDLILWADVVIRLYKKKLPPIWVAVLLLAKSPRLQVVLSAKEEKLIFKNIHNYHQLHLLLRNKLKSYLFILLYIIKYSRCCVILFSYVLFFYYYFWKSSKRTCTDRVISREKSELYFLLQNACIHSSNFRSPVFTESICFSSSLSISR